jgi:aryl-alcohol dehydrogenase-like predicted oxidoreductase
VTGTGSLAAASGTVSIAPGLVVSRLGYGAMRITGPGIWGDPPDPVAAIRLLRRAVELGVDFIDTADSYGPHVSEELIARALQPYRGVTVATKGGLVRTGPDEWYPVGRPEYLRQCVEMSLRRLRVETISLYQLHRVDPQVPLKDQLGMLADLRAAGKIGHIGLSEVTAAQLAEARLIAPVVSVQNRYNLADTGSDPVVGYCERHGLAFISWAPMGSGLLSDAGGILATISRDLGASPAQVALAWLLHRSPVLLPIPGTTTAAHLEENLAAARLELTDQQFDELSAIAPVTPARAAGTSGGAAAG